MSLTLTDHRALLKGFADAGYCCETEPDAARNPICLEWRLSGGTWHYRLWAFEITHGGGGPTVRAADEFRIQITNGPDAVAELDSGALDLLVGYSPDRDAIVAYDRRWLENWSKKKQDTGTGGSPSVQVKEADIQAGHQKGIHHLTKDAGFGQADIVTMTPAMLPTFLANHAGVMTGNITVASAQAATPQPGDMTVVDYCAQQGFPFEADLIARYVAALLTKPFVILAGVSGTGKSKLPQLVAEYYSADLVAQGAPTGSPIPGDGFVFVPQRGAPNAARFCLVAVRPDWIDNQSILGFVNPITHRYESTQALDLILRARRDLDGAPDKADAPRYFMLFDEMNLARVEHYLSDWLACAESRRLRPDGRVTQAAVPLHRSDAPLEMTLGGPDGSRETVAVPPSLELPTNLIVTGTVNVDETTYGFSPKVLDRATVLEFDEVNLDRLRSHETITATGGYRFPETLPPFCLATREDYARLPLGAHQHLVTINAILEEARLHFGYRSANEIALFMTIFNDLLPPSTTDTDWLRALDAAVLQKILPRLSGNRSKLEIPLAKVSRYFLDLTRPTSDAALDEFNPTTTARLPKSYRRAIEMLEHLRRFGFVSFFK